MTSVSGQGRFDRWAKSYDRSVLQRLIFGPVHDATLNACSAASDAPRDLLDIGCGTGRLLEAAGRRWSTTHLVGVDVSESMVAEARRKHEGDARFSFKQGDASALPVETTSFDVVLSTMSFHHWGDQSAGLSEVARVLRPGGQFVLVDMYPPLLRLLRPLLKRTDHANVQGPDVIRCLVEQAGLRVERFRSFWPATRAQLFVARRG